MGCPKLKYCTQGLALVWNKNESEKPKKTIPLNGIACTAKAELMPDHIPSESYLYGFQGQEKDDEVKGAGNSINYKYRMHDPRLGRFFAVDPLHGVYPWNSPYSFSENRVLDGIELEGKEWQAVDADGNEVEANGANVAAYYFKGYSTTVIGYEWAGTTVENYSDIPLIHDPNSVKTIYEPLIGTVDYAVVRDKCENDGQTHEEIVVYSINFEDGCDQVNVYDLESKSLVFEGVMVDNGNGLLAEGDFTLNSTFENGTVLEDESWDANSGPWGNGSVENGEYTADNPRNPRNGQDGMTRNGVSFSFDLNPLFETGRTALRIHPDGPTYLGTMGCIGLTCEADELNDFYDKVNNYLTNYAESNGSINVSFNADNNPNHNGDGPQNAEAQEGE